MTDDGSTAPVARIAAIDMLRGFAIIWVVLFHLWVDMEFVPFPPADYYHTFWDRVRLGEWGSVGTAAIDAFCRIGFQGVPLFMMLSGLALYLSAERSGRIDLVPWYWKRLARIVLPYWAGVGLFMLTICGIALVQVWLNGRDFAYQYHHGVTIANYHVLDMSWTDLYASLAIYTRLQSDEWFGMVPTSLWFVVIILQYYLLFPFLKPLLDRIGPWWFVGGALAITVVCKALIIYTQGALLLGLGPRLDGGVAPFRIYDFAIGMGLGYLFVHRPGLLRDLASGPAAIASLIAFGALLQIGGTLTDDRQAYVNALGAPMVISGLTLLVLPLLVKAPGRLEATPPAQVLAWTGVISYAVLIVNEPMRLVASLLRGHQVPEAWWWLFLVAVYVPVSVLLARPFAVLVGLVPRDRGHAAAPARVSTPAEALAET